MIFDAEKLRNRIRHFLLQQSKLYNRVVGKKSEALPPVSAMAAELSQIIEMPHRRIQKYLTENLPPKEISITAEDLFEFAKLSAQPIGEFVSYLAGEPPSNHLTEVQKNWIAFLSQLHDGHRRSLNATLLSSNHPKKSERIIDLAIKLYGLPDQDIHVIEEVLKPFVERANRSV